MTKVVFAVILTVIFALAMSANTRITDMTTAVTGSTDTMATAMNQGSSSNESKDLDIEAVMNACNETFRIEMAYLDSLNNSGSFVDETDRTPKCFIRCMLENTGILSSDYTMFNTARAAVLFAGDRNGIPMEDIGDITALCAANRNELCTCNKAYQFMRCVMSMEIEKYDKN